MRELKYHEQKLLKKTNFLNYSREQNLRELHVIKRYHIQDREDYTRYNKIVGRLTKMVNSLKNLPPNDSVRIALTDQLLEKLYEMGLINSGKNLQEVDKITVSTFCRRRLPVVMVRLKFAETLNEAVTLVEQGHIRVGPEAITDPAYLVTRTMEDFVTWVDTSKIKRKIAKYNDKLDDYDLLA